MTEPTRFERTEELLTAVTAATSMADEYRSSLTSPESFAGVRLNEAVDLARLGWKGGNQTIKRLSMDIERMIEGSIPLPEIYYDVTGDVIDMGKFVADEPECMMSIVDSAMLRPSTMPKVLRVVYNIGISGAVKADTVLLRGAATLVMVDTLEKHGVRCQVDLAYGVSNKVHGGDVREYYLTVKKDGDHMSVEKLAFFLGHLSSIRRLFFALLEHEPDDVRRKFGIGRDNGGSNGFPAEVTDTGDIYIDRILTNTDWSEAFTMLWLRSVLTKQGLNLTFLANDKEEKSERTDNLAEQALAKLGV